MLIGAYTYIFMDYDIWTQVLAHLSLFGEKPKIPYHGLNMTLYRFNLGLREKKKIFSTLQYFV